MTKDTLYYDGQCALCSYEIEQLRAHCDSDLQLLDIHTLAQDPTLPPRNLLLRKLHLRKADRTLLVGLDANIAAWQHTSVGWVWRLLRLPGLRPILNYCYEKWAGWRFRRLYGADGSLPSPTHAVTGEEKHAH